MDFQNKNQYQYPSDFSLNDQFAYQNSDNYSNSKEEEARTEIDTMIRLGFVRKVYGILSVQLFVTTAFTLIAMISDSLKIFMLNNIGLLLIMVLLEIFLPCAIVCCNGQMRQYPQNYIILTVFTVAESYIVGFICAFTKPEVVFMAASMTFVMVLSLTLYAITTKNDITINGGLIFIMAAAFFLFCIFGIFIHNKLFHVILALIGVILFSIYIIYDTQLIMGNRREMIEVDDYILGAFMLYTDIINIFIELLKIFSYFSDN